MSSSPETACPITAPSDAKAVGHAQRLDQVADNLAAGKRETPQRFMPIGRWAAERPEALLGLVRYLLGDAINEAKQETGFAPEALDLLLRLSEAVGLSGPPHIPDVLGLEQMILALVPRVRRRRSIHCNGQIASDRRLLLARHVFDIFEDWRLTWWEFDLWKASAYATANYDYDHFEMAGPDVERRVRGLAHWLKEWAASPGADLSPAASTAWADELKATWRKRRQIEEEKERAEAHIRVDQH